MSFTPLIEALQRGATVITPTNRLQRELLWLYVEYRNTQVTPHPQCFSYENWLETSYHDYTFNHPDDLTETTIDDWQLHFLWKIKANHQLGRPQHFSECQQALSALKNCALSLVTPEGSDFLYTPMAHHFHKIWKQVTKTLQQKQLLPSLLFAAKLLDKPFVTRNSEIIWACFDTFHPLQQALIEHLERQGVKQYFFDMHRPTLFHDHQDCLESLCKPPLHENIYYLQALDGHDELEQIILWLKQHRNEGAQRLGLVVPDLSLQKSALYRQLRMHFPEEDLHFSLGDALSEFPIVRHAMMCLTLNTATRLSREQCRILLTSPFIAGFEKEEEARHRIRLNHPLLKESEIPYVEFIKSLESTCPILAETLGKVQEYPTHIDSTHLAQRLSTMGFPGKKSLTTHQQAILQKLYQIFESSHHLKIIQAKLSSSELLDEINNRVQNTVHQAPQNADGIHIMGWLESSGFKGDAVWICHFTSQLIPQPINYSPLLPIAWQKQHQLPRTNQAKETAIATQIFLRLLHSHTQVVVSMAEQIEQQVQWPSPLLPTKWTPYLRLIPPSVPPACLEPVPETFEIPLRDQQTLKGGSYLLSVFAQCPFQAFASYRLGLAEPNKEEFGLNPLQRGQLLHQCLYQLWENLKTQQALLDLDPESLNELIQNTIIQSITSFAAFKPYSLDEFLMSLEIDHLSQLLKHVLELDKQRPPFKIYGLEQNIELNIDDWPFQLRYDRIDELSDGTKCLIDYKSSLPSPLPWNQEQALYPQILMYALADASIKALLFMVMKIQDIELSGISATDTHIQGVKIAKEEWSIQQQKWLKHIRELILNIRSGLCRPQPARASTCQKCVYQDLCRVSQQDDGR